MSKWIKSAIMSAAMLATCLAPLSEAAARGRHGGGPYYGGGGYHQGGGYRPQHYRGKSRSHRGDAVAAGIIGLGVGAIIGSALAKPSSPPPPRTYYRTPQPVYNGLEPWSPGWYQYCGQRYRSFNPNTGTFRGYDGQDHFCVAN